MYSIWYCTGTLDLGRVYFTPLLNLLVNLWTVLVPLLPGLYTGTVPTGTILYIKNYILLHLLYLYCVSSAASSGILP